MALNVKLSSKIQSRISILMTKLVQQIWFTLSSYDEDCDCVKYIFIIYVVHLKKTNYICVHDIPANYVYNRVKQPCVVVGL